MIYIVKHKDCEIPKLPGYTQIGVGKLFNYKGDNINYLNPYLNETTALYDIWKNTDDEIIGMCHYRRFFKSDNGGILTFIEAEHILNEWGYEMIAPFEFHPPVTPYDWLSRAIETHILEKYIPQLPEDFQKWLNEPNVFNPCNMFVSRRNTIEAYCEWMFPIMIPLAERFMREDSGKSFKDDRALGFVCEMIFGYWCHKIRIANIHRVEFRTIEV